MQSKSSQLTHPKQHPSLLMYVQYALSLVVCTAAQRGRSSTVAVKFHMLHLWWMVLMIRMTTMTVHSDAFGLNRWQLYFMQRKSL